MNAAEPLSGRPTLPAFFRAEAALAVLDESAERARIGATLLRAEVAATDDPSDLAWTSRRRGSLRAASAATRYAEMLLWWARREILTTLRAGSEAKP